MNEKILYYKTKLLGHLSLFADIIISNNILKQTKLKLRTTNILLISKRIDLIEVKKSINMPSFSNYRNKNVVYFNCLK